MNAKRTVAYLLLAFAASALSACDDSTDAKGSHNTRSGLESAPYDCRQGEQSEEMLRRCPRIVPEYQPSQPRTWTPGQ